MFKLSISRFRKVTLITIINVYLVIIAGGVVRCTGSGMGCPDWPKCFGQWVPPIDEKQLPIDYIKKYSKVGHTVIFNVLKTWTEYVNRLLGAIVGLFVICVFYYSLVYYKTNRVIITIISFVNIFIIGFQGWLGSRVVASNLAPYMISIHMIIALVIVALLILIYSLSNEQFRAVKISQMLILVCIFFTLIQILIGTQVRQEIDLISYVSNYNFRDLWISQLSYKFNIHRVFAYFIILVNGILIYKLHLVKLYFYRNLIGLLVLFELLSGFILTYFDLPSYIQPIHLVLASIIFGIQFYILTINREAIS